MPTKKYPPPTAAAPMLDGRAIAARLGISRTRAYELMRQMPHHEFGRSLRVDAADLARWLESRRLPARESLAEQARKYREEMAARYASRTRKPPKPGSASSSEAERTRPVVRRTGEPADTRRTRRHIVPRTKPLKP